MALSTPNPGKFTNNLMLHKLKYCDYRASQPLPPMDDKLFPPMDSVKQVHEAFKETMSAIRSVKKKAVHRAAKICFGLNYLPAKSTVHDHYKAWRLVDREYLASALERDGSWHEVAYHFKHSARSNNPHIPDGSTDVEPLESK